jgi:type I restriction enzyme M protein
MTENLELEKTLWQAADKLRNNMDAAEYKHVVLGLIFLKYISDAFDELYSHSIETKHQKNFKTTRLSSRLTGIGKPNES